MNVAVAAANFAHVFAAKMLAYVRSSLNPSYKIVQCSTSNNPAVESGLLEETLRRAQPLALIGLSIRPDPAVVSAYRAAGVPVVLIDEELEGTSTVTCDNYMGGYLAGDHLAKTGHRRVGVVSGQTSIRGGYNAVQRLTGLTKALAANGLNIPDGGLIEVRHYSYDEGVEAMARFLDERRGVDAIFSAAGDDLAMGLLELATERGVHVPEEIALVGYDDAEVARTSTPPLTTIRQPLEEMARTACHLALNQRAEILVKPRRVIYTPELVVRAST
jgi:DNA-binding LacI/PurR family transcriptional regulator